MRRTGFIALFALGALAASVFGLIEAASAGTPASQSGSFGDRQTREIEKIVHDYLVAHPEVLIEAMQALDEKQVSEEKILQGKAIAANRAAIYDDPSSFVAGNPEGDVTVVEFFDYQCGFCKRSFGPLMETIKADGNIRLILKEFPILGPESVTASHAAFAAMRQGKYFELHQALFRNKGELSDEKLMRIASGAGLDTARLKRDMADPKIEDLIDRNYELARALAIKGTPAFIIGGQVSPGALNAEQLVAAVSEARERCGASC